MGPVQTSETWSGSLEGSSLRIEVSWSAQPDLPQSERPEASCFQPTPAAWEASACLCCIAAGIGSPEASALASRMAVDTVRGLFLARNGEASGRFLRQAVQQANLVIYGARRAARERYTMQTTLTALLLEREQLAVAHVGDCRLYRVRGDEVDVLTRDHTVAMDLLRTRLISEDQAMEHPGRYQLTRTIGQDAQVRVDSAAHPLEPGDTYLLCSDGLWGQVPADEMSEVLGEGTTREACDRVVNLAQERGGPENVTAVVFRVIAPPAAGKPGPRWQRLFPWRKAKVGGI